MRGGVLCRCVRACVCAGPCVRRGVVQVPHEHGESAIQVRCVWSNTAHTIQALSMDEDDYADFVADSMDEEDEHNVS